MTDHRQTILAHNDGDGVISATILKTKFPKAHVCFGAPMKLPRIGEVVEELYIADIAVNQRDPAYTLSFAKEHALRIELWADHHQGTEILKTHINGKLILDNAEPSCASLLKGRGFKAPAEWIKAANHLDRPFDFADSKLARVFHQGYLGAKSQSNEAGRKFYHDFLNYLLDDKDAATKISASVKYYDKIKNATAKARRSLKAITSDLGLIEVNNLVDKKTLFTKAYERFDTLMIRDLRQGHGIAIGTKNKDLDLLEVFDRTAGCPERITLKDNSKETLSNAIDKLQNA